jgi:hypothetical protein
MSKVPYIFRKDGFHELRAPLCSGEVLSESIPIGTDMMEVISAFFKLQHRGWFIDNSPTRAEYDPA